MTPGIAILDQFESLGGRVTLGEGDCLRCEFPRGMAKARTLIKALREWKADVVEILKDRQAPLGTSAPPECPLLPKGVRLVKYAPKTPPVAIAPVSIVNDVRRFIEAKLAELDARLNKPIQIRAGDGVFEILSKLAEVGVELAIEVPERGTPTKS